MACFLAKIEYPGTGVTCDTLITDLALVMRECDGKQTEGSACDNDVSQRRDGETDRNDIEVDRERERAMDAYNVEVR